MRHIQNRPAANPTSPSCPIGIVSTPSIGLGPKEPMPVGAAAKRPNATITSATVEANICRAIVRPRRARLFDSAMASFSSSKSMAGSIAPRVREVNPDTTTHLRPLGSMAIRSRAFWSSTLKAVVRSLRAVAHVPLNNSVGDLLGRLPPIKDMTSDAIMRPCDGRFGARSILTSNVTE